MELFYPQTVVNLVQRAREATGLDPRGFAKVFGLSRGRLWLWEHGWLPSAAASALLVLIEAHPNLAVRTLAKHHGIKLRWTVPLRMRHNPLSADDDTFKAIT